MIKVLVEHTEVIHKDLNGSLYEVGEDGRHTPLKIHQSITQFEWHPSMSKGSKRACKSGLLLVLRGGANLMVTIIPIKETIPPLPPQSVSIDQTMAKGSNPLPWFH